MKEAHESKVTDAIKAAIDQEASGVKTGTGAIDTGLRSSNAAATAEGLLESMGLDEVGDQGLAVTGLKEVRLTLQRLSKSALDTLSQLMNLWLQQCRIMDHGTPGIEFGDPGKPGPILPLEAVKNRVLIGKMNSVNDAVQELKTFKILSEEIDQDERRAYYFFEQQWSVGFGYNFWRCAAEFLYFGHGVEIQDWVKGLDFTIFDRTAAPERDVPWR